MLCLRHGIGGPGGSALAVMLMLGAATSVVATVAQPTDAASVGTWCSARWRPTPVPGDTSYTQDALVRDILAVTT